MKKKLELGLIFCSAIVIASAISHVMVRELGIRTGGIGYKLLGESEEGKTLAVAQGSSLMVEGLAWRQISKTMEVGIENWFVAGSSPSEWEVLSSRSDSAPITFVAVSAYDLNENFLCDYRAEVVPISRTVRDLWHSQADWEFSKRVLSQYPRKYVRILFPTVGRSDGVMVGIREQLRIRLKPILRLESEAGPTVRPTDGGAEQTASELKVTDWSDARVLRRLALMRAACENKHDYEGPKKLALNRLVKEAAGREGGVIVVVLPVSPLYAKEFLTSEVLRRFEDAITATQQGAPDAQWIRLDQVAELRSDECFWDFVHLNVDGRRIATETLLKQLGTYPATN